VTVLRPGIKDRVAIVTGASSGLGWATVEALAASGAKVFAVGRRTERLEALRSATGCDIFAGDASESVICDGVIQLALNKFGRVDILINNAGMGNYKQLVDTTVEEYDELMRVNIRSSFLFSRAVASGMIERRSGSIIFVASVAGVTGTANESVYCATKFAQVGFAQALDQELFSHGIKVTTLIAGGMKTEFAIGRGREVEAVQSSAMMDPRDVAEAVLFICDQPDGVRIPSFTIRHMGRRS
jgi:NADP-dependent 3-hydroxy acid dehydrogenase YdfG